MTNVVSITRIDVERTNGPETVAITALDLRHPLRSSGTDADHVRALAESDLPLPPITVHRATMRIVDGLHRVRAALLCGETVVPVVYFDGDERGALVHALQLNSMHGLPLSRADRVLAAERMVSAHPEWSDRAIAELVGISAKTVGVVRPRATADSPQMNRRIGKDGKVRPLSTAVGRQIAAQLFAERPGAGLREIAKDAGISVGTARDVRQRLERDEDPLPLRERKPAGSADKTVVTNTALESGPQLVPQPEFRRMLELLMRDPSLRLSETGRRVLRILDAHLVSEAQRLQLIDAIPGHATGVMGDMAFACAQWWVQFANALRTRDGSEDDQP